MLYSSPVSLTLCIPAIVNHFLSSTQFLFSSTHLRKPHSLALPPRPQSNHHKSLSPTNRTPLPSKHHKLITHKSQPPVTLLLPCFFSPPSRLSSCRALHARRQPTRQAVRGRRICDLGQGRLGESAGREQGPGSQGRKEWSKRKARFRPP